jgi:FtsP/CotA-like multicopper oxidase with cupredoxin domain
MFANPNNRPAPKPPFKPFPPGYEFAQDPIPVVTHLHGGVTPADSDGFVTAWFTKDEEKKGPDFKSSTFEYFNAQLPTTLWYHDHTLGMTRLTVAAGLAGAYLLRTRMIRSPRCFHQEVRVSLLIQDRAFNDDGRSASSPRSATTP